MITYGRASQDDGAVFRSSGSGVECTPRRTVHFENDLKGIHERLKSLQRQENTGENTDDGRSRARRTGLAKLVETGSLSDELGSSQVNPRPVGKMPCPMRPTGLKSFGGTNTQDSKSDKTLIARDLSPAESTMEAPGNASNREPSEHILSSTKSSRSLRGEDSPQSLAQQSSRSGKPPSAQTDEPDACFLKQNKLVSTVSPVSPKIPLRPEQDSSLLSLKKYRSGNDHDELSVLVSIPPSGNARTNILNSKKAQKEAGHTRSDGLGSDEIAIGLPVEQYNPRPSRSRSGETNADLFIPADFSKKPETIVKRKKNRRKTTAFERPLHESEEERDIAQVRDPIVLIKSRSEAAVTLQVLENDSVFKAPIDALPQIQEAENVSKPLPSKRRGRPKKQVQEPVEESDPLADKIENLSKVSELRSEIMLSPTKPLRKKRKVSPDPSASNGSDSETPQFSDEDALSIPDSRKHNIIPAKAQVSSTVHLPSPSTTQSLSSPFKPSIPLPQTPQKEVKGPDKHSPLNTGKLSHRVGLSKRARIAPLLKIVRK